MSFNPCDQARDDARSGRMLTPGADPSVYWVELNAKLAKAHQDNHSDQYGGVP